MIAIVCAAANLTAQAVWLSANPSASLATMPSALVVNCTTVSTLLYCLLNNVLCDLVQSYLVRTYGTGQVRAGVGRLGQGTGLGS